MLLDVLYYDNLLQGAVDALIQFEKEHPEIYMSTTIEKRFDNRGLWIIKLVYSVILVPLALFTIWSWKEYCKEICRNKNS